MVGLEEGSAAAGGRRPTRPHRSADNQQDAEPKLPRALPPARTIRLGQSRPFVLFGATPATTTRQAPETARSGRSAFPPQWAVRRRMDPRPRAESQGAQPLNGAFTSRSDPAPVFPPQHAISYRMDPGRAKCPGAQPTGKTCTSRSDPMTLNGAFTSRSDPTPVTPHLTPHLVPCTATGDAARASLR